MPKTVHVTDITGRDGFQNIKEWIPTELKLQVLDMLVEAGVRKMEGTSFVSPKAIPQMAVEALQSGSPGNTLREVTEHDMVALYQSLY